MSLLTHQSFANTDTPYWASASKPTSLVSPLSVVDKYGTPTKKAVITANGNGTGGVFYANENGGNPLGMAFAQGATQPQNQLIFDIGNVNPVLTLTSSNVVATQPIVLDTAVNPNNFSISQTASNTVLAQGVGGGTIELLNSAPSVSVNGVVEMDSTGLIQTWNGNVDLYINPSKAGIYFSNILSTGVATFGLSGTSAYLGTGLPPVLTPGVLANEFNGAELRFNDGSVNVYGMKSTGGNLVISTPSVSSAISIAPSGQVSIPDIISGSFVPIGGIVMFSGNPATLPANWKVCDGVYPGTPDLTNKFIIGAGTFASGTSGGSATIDISNLPSHTHALTDPGHSHGITDPGHFHTTTAMSQGNEGTNGLAFGRLGNNQGNNSDTKTTGITINTATTGITIANTGGGSNYYPPYYALAYIIRVA